MSRLIVSGSARSMTAAMCASILGAAGLEPGKRKIIGTSAKLAPHVVEMAPPLDATGADVVLVTGTEAIASADARLVVADVRAGEGTSTYGLEDDASSSVTPGWLGALVPADPESGAQPFDLYAGGSYCGRFALKVRGPENVRSAIAAIAACAEGFQVHIETARRALGAFAP